MGKVIFISFLSYFALVSSLPTISIGDLSKSNSLKPLEEVISGYGYPAETHYIETEDGYILTVHRVPYGRKESNSNSRVPVLFGHGLGANGGVFVILGPERSLGLILADEGYDVWLLNARGNGYSNNHTSLDPIENPDKFYDFSWHEIGKYDLAATIDYILDTTGHPSLFYVGHSQGGTTLYVLTSERPEYNKKIRLASLMAPSAIMKNVPLPLIRYAADNIYYIEKAVRSLKLYVLPTEIFRVPILGFCKSPALSKICSNIYMIFSFSDPNQFNEEFISPILEILPSPLAVKQLFHYGQIIRNNGTFRKYDFGKTKNLAKYNSTKPPMYDLKKITAPIALYYSKNDMMISISDIDALSKAGPNVVHKYLVPFDKYTHNDHIFATDSFQLEYKELIAKMSEY